MDSKLMQGMKAYLTDKLSLESAYFKLKTDDMYSRLNEEEKEYFTSYVQCITNMVDRIAEECIVRLYKCISEVAVDLIVKKNL